MSNCCSSQAHVQGFDFEYITFNKSINMFKHMEIAEYIYEGVLETFYKQSTRSDATRAGHIRKKESRIFLVPYLLQDKWEQWQAQKKVCRLPDG